MGKTAAEEWSSNGARRRRCAAVVLAPDEEGNPPDCAICGQPGADSIDHKLPKVRFRELMWDLGNMQPAHESCNKAKGDKVTGLSLGSQSEQW